MALSEQQQRPRIVIEEDNYCEIEGSDWSDDSQDDPTYDIVEETRSRFSNLSMQKNPKSRVQRKMDLGFVVDLYDGEIAAPVFDKTDEKSFEMVQKMIEDDQIEKLKVDQCKVYLRKNGLRLTGTKDTLIQRIKEHIDIINGGGEKKYPVSSFVLNCKGDACTGDVIMFEQNVYEMYSIASRSASGPPCGTRIIAGRIVKESYGAAKQQHTFTLEVLWSKGEKPLPPLHPLLIKGRNLYRLKTLRQRWEDEGERQRVLMEKHSRGSLARANREVRIQAKEMRKDKRHSADTGKAEPKRNDFQLNPVKLVQPPTQQKRSCYQDQQWEDEGERQRVLMEKHPRCSLARANREVIQAKEMHKDRRHSTDTRTTKPRKNDFQLHPEKLVQPPTQQNQSGFQDQHSSNHHVVRPMLHSSPRRDPFFADNYSYGEPRLLSSPRRDRFFADNYSYGEPSRLSSPRRGRSLDDNYSHREPSRSMSHFPPFNPQLRRDYPPLAPSRNHHPPLSSSWGRTHNQVCRHYARGRCSFGENCRFLHDFR